MLLQGYDAASIFLVQRILSSIPSRSHFDKLKNVLDVLSRSRIECLIYDNGYPDSVKNEVRSLAECVDATGWKFYRMWNDAITTARDRGYEYLALLNDDIDIHPGSIQLAVNVMDEDKKIGIAGLNYRRKVSDGLDVNAGFKVTRGTYKDGGIWGCGFVLRLSIFDVVPLIDERYNLWYGDDELISNISNAGFLTGIASGSPMDHEGSATTNLFPELIALTGEDEKLFKSKFL